MERMVSDDGNAVRVTYRRCADGFEGQASHLRVAHGKTLAFAKA